TVAPPVQKGLVIHHANTNQCYGKAITTDANDNIIAAELFQTNISGKSFNSAGTIDGLFSKYDKNGNLIWDKTAGGANCITTPHGVVMQLAMYLLLVILGKQPTQQAELFRLTRKQLPQKVITMFFWQNTILQVAFNGLWL
ncbi:MAG: hypothetical protein ACKO1F_07175, partial [Flammeovirgaceae bacterium]